MTPIYLYKKIFTCLYLKKEKREYNFPHHDYLSPPTLSFKKLSKPDRSKDLFGNPRETYAAHSLH
jgi:hypothetical protein